MNAQERELEELAKFNNAIDNVLDIDPDFNESRGVNRPQLASGLTPVTIDGSGTISPINSRSSDWYDYLVENKEDLKWANAKSNDGSLWVWIPRFAYKVNSSIQTIDIVFLKGTTDEPAEKTSSGKSKDEIEIKRANDTTASTEGKDIYIVHPAFCDGSNNGYANGEWNKEITGFWMSKFEAAFPEKTKGQNSELKYTAVGGANYYDGTYTVDTNMVYPEFKPNRPSYNYICINDMFKLCQAMNDTGKNPYEFTETVDTHMTKNSEWGAVAYLSWCKNTGIGQELNINNISGNNNNNIYAITGYGGSSPNVGEQQVNPTTYITDSGTPTVTNGWTSEQGQNASTTGNTTGVYDMSGGLWEVMASYVNGTLTTYGKDSFTDNNSTPKNSDRYRTYYSITNEQKGDAVRETLGWCGDAQGYPTSARPFFMHRRRLGECNSCGSVCLP